VSPDSAPALEGILARGRRSMLALLVQKLTTPALSFAITVLLARGLSRQAYGTYSLLQGTLPYFGLVTGLGLAYGFLRFIPEYHDTGRDGLARRLIRTGLLLRLLACLVAFGLALLFSGPLLAFFGIAGYGTAFRIFALSTMLFLEVTLAFQALNALFLTAYAVAGQIAYTAIKAALLLALLLGGRLSLGLALWVEVASAGAFLTIVGVSYRLRWERTVGEPASLAGQRLRLLRFCGWNALSDAGNTVFSTATDFLIIGHFLGTVALAPYYLATQVCGLIGRANVVFLFQVAVSPMFFAQYARNRGRLNETYQIVVKMCLFGVIPIVAVYPFLGRQVIELVGGGRYPSAFGLVAVLVAAAPVSALAYPTGLVLQSLERADRITYSSVFAFYNVAAAILLIPHFGVYGVAFATATAVLAQNGYLVFWAHRLGGVSPPWSAGLKLAVNAGVTSLAAWGLGHLVGGGGPLLLAASFLVCGGVYLLASTVNPLLTNAEAQVVDRLVGRKVWRF